MADEVRSRPNSVPYAGWGGIRAWSSRLLVWQSWAHAVVAGLVGAIGGWVTPWIVFPAGLAGALGFAVTGLVVLVVFGGLFAACAAWFHRTARSALWLGLSVIPWMAVLMATFAADWLGPVMGGITAAAFALVSWRGPQRLIAVGGLIAALVLIPPWPPRPDTPADPLAANETGRHPFG